MRPRGFVRPAAAGAVCFAATCAAAPAAHAQADTTRAASPRIDVDHRKLDVRAGKRAAVVGNVAPGTKGLTVSLQVRRGRTWKPIDRDRTDAAGRYRLRERVRRTGSVRVRVRVAGAPGLAPGKRVIGRLNVFRVAHASWYGPGFYGNRTGCGSTLHVGRLGVAHKTLPCGTRVTLRHGKRTVRVRVIDRGPYVGGREYDLTAATAQRLRFEGHGPILTTH